MRHHYLRTEPASSSAHWAVGRCATPTEAVLIQIGDAKGGQARTSNTTSEAIAFAQQLRSVLQFADRIPISLTENGETVRIVLHREDGLELADAIEAITR